MNQESWKKLEKNLCFILSTDLGEFCFQLLLLTTKQLHSKEIKAYAQIYPSDDNTCLEYNIEFKKLNIYTMNVNKLYLWMNTLNVAISIKACETVQKICIEHLRLNFLFWVYAPKVLECLCSADLFLLLWLPSNEKKNKKRLFCDSNSNIKLNTHRSDFSFYRSKWLNINAIVVL